MDVEVAETLNKSVTKLGTEFKLPNISSPWLAKEFSISLHPTDCFVPGQGIRVPPTELFNLGPAGETVEREVAPIPFPDTSRLHRRLQNLSEQHEEIKRIAAEWRSDDYKADLYEEGFGENQISEQSAYFDWGENGPF